VCPFVFILFLSTVNSDPSQTVNYSGKKIFFEVDSSVVRIYGESKASYGKLNISSDTLLYDLEKKFLYAKGNVIFNDGNNDIKAKSMSYDVDLRIGDAYKARTEAEDGWFYGERIRYFNGNVLRIKNGYYTTCELDPPHFWFYSPKMRINIDQDLIAEPVILLVKDIPIFFVPFYFQSIKKERSSGLLRPDFGTSSYAGNYIKRIGWYQTLGPHADITAYLNYYTKTGVRFDINKARWNLLPYSEGDIGGNYIKDKESGEERWSVSADSRSKLPGNINVNVDTRIESDNEYAKDYEPGEVERILQKEINYNVYWKGEILDTKTDIVFDYRENLATEQLNKRWPSVNMTFPRIKLGDIYFTSKYKFTRDETSHWASGLSGKANLNTKFSVFNIGINFSGQSDYYENEDIFVNHWKTGASINTRMYGLSVFGIPPISKFRHIIIPAVSFSYAPDPGEYDILRISNFSIPGGSKSVNFSLNNQFQCKIGKKKYDFAELNFSSSYRPTTDRLSPVSINGIFRLGQVLNQRYFTSYDLYESEFGDKRVNTSFEYNAGFGGKPLDLNLTHSVNFTEEKRIQQADMTVDFNPTPKWRVGISTHYDFERGRVTNSRINLKRDLHCWDLILSVNTFGDDWNYSVSLRLKDIPGLKIGRETLGGLMP
jgi:lipopolysaccharide assembly outer membrane protein LptD (OstA)